MSYQLQIKEEPDYLHIIATGENSKKNISDYLEEVIRTCRDRGTGKVLIEERLTGPRLGTLDVFEVASEGSRRLLGKLKMIAYIDVFAETDLIHFAETVSVNRGVPVRIFINVQTAKKWLTE